jgi:OmpA-OmpF porin, OOP family
MSKARSSFAIIGLASALAFTGPSFAQDGAFYVGGSIGQTDVKDGCTGLNVPGVSCDDEDTSWKIFGGYQFNRNFALELGYVDLGEVKASGPGGTATIEATAFELVGVGMLPLANNFSLYGKIGLYRAETEVSVNTFLLVASEDESNTDLTFGIGAQFDVSKQFAIRAEWQRYQDVGGGDIGESDVDVISVGALFRF